MNSVPGNWSKTEPAVASGRDRERNQVWWRYSDRQATARASLTDARPCTPTLGQDWWQQPEITTPGTRLCREQIRSARSCARTKSYARRNRRSEDQAEIESLTGGRTKTTRREKETKLWQRQKSEEQPGGEWDRKNEPRAGEQIQAWEN
jgi:hypothetical protein